MQVQCVQYFARVIQEAIWQVTVELVHATSRRNRERMGRPYLVVELWSIGCVAFEKYDNV